MKMIEGLSRRRRYNEHMGCIKGCLEYLGSDVTFPWLYGGTTHAFVLNMNDAVFVDCAMAWDTASLFGLYPNLGFRRDGLVHDPGMGDDASPEVFLQKQREAWDFVREVCAFKPPGLLIALCISRLWLAEGIPPTRNGLVRFSRRFQ